MKKAEFRAKLRMFLEFAGQDECWRWFPDWHDADRERVCMNGRRPLVRRHIYELVLEMGRRLAGPLAKNQPLVRTCDTKGCLNPFHQVPAISAAELVRTGQWRGAPNDPRGAHNREKQRCPYGHPYIPGNVSYTRTGRRRCLACHRERAWLPLDWRWVVYGFRDAAAGSSRIAALLDAHSRRGA